MAFRYRKILEGLGLVPKTTSANSDQGDLEVLSTDGKIYYHNGTINSPLVTEDGSATLLNKNLDDTTTAIVDTTDPTKRIKFDAAGTTGTTTTIAGSQTANRTLTLPDATDTLVARSTTDTLENKSLKDDTNAFVDAADLTKKIAFDAGGTTGTTTTLAATQTANRTLTLPDATDTLVGKNTTDTLTNKSLVDNSTAIVDNSDPTKQIKFDAAGTTATSTTLLSSQTVNRTLTLPDATDTLVARSTTDTLTNKTLSEPIISNDIVFTNQGLTPSNPAPGFLKVYSKNDDNVYKLNSSGSESTLGGGGSIAIKENGVTIETSATSIDFAEGIEAISLGGGAVQINTTPTPFTHSLIEQMAQFKSGKLLAQDGNQLMDDFKSNRGLLVDLAMGGGALRPNAGETTGTYERYRDTGTILQRVDASSIFSAQGLAPKATAIVTGAGISTIKFPTDVTEFFPIGAFPTGVKVAFYTEDVTGYNNENACIPLNDANGDLVQLTINSVSYNSGLNETTLVVANTLPYDVSMGLSTPNLPIKLRVVPWGYLAQAKTALGGTYESLPISDVSIYGPGTINIVGENFLQVVSGTLAGAVLKMAANCSVNRQYGAAMVLEKTASNSLWHFFYSADYLNTWVELGTVTTASSEAEELAGEFGFINNENIFVANNGKAFFAYYIGASANGKYAAGYYSDLSAGSPVLSNTPTTGSGVGIIDPSSSGVYEVRHWKVAGDPIDGSFISVVVTDNTNVGRIYFYTAGGSTFQNSSLVSTSISATTQPALKIYGTGVAHRTVLVHHVTGVGRLDFHYYDQPSATEVGTSTIVATGTGDNYIQDCDLNGDRLTIFFVKDSDGKVNFITGIISGTPSFSSFEQLSTIAGDKFVGWSSAAIINFYKRAGQSIISNPSDPEHSIMTLDLVHPSGERRATVYEIADVSNFNGVYISQYSTTGATNFRDTSSNTQKGQTFLTGGEPIKTFAYLAYQNGTIPSGYILTAELQETSAGIPTGVVVATSNNSYDPSKITKSTSGQYLYFNFNGVAPTASTYAVVLVGTFPISASNYLKLLVSTANPYANGTVVKYDGSTWTTTASDDLVFEVNGDWVTDVGLAEDDPVSPFNVKIDDQESSIRLSGSSTALILSRRITVISDNYRPLNGHTYKRAMSLSATPASVQSVISDDVVFGYAPANHDPFLALSVALGDSACGRKSVSTGVIDTTKLAEERSGHELNTADYTTVTFAADASFESGQCGVFSGANHIKISPASSALFDIVLGKPFIMEMEIEDGGSNQVLLDSGSGVQFFINASGFLSFSTASSTAFTTASDAIESTTYHKVRVTYDGTTTKLWRDTGSGFVEVTSYSAQNISATVMTDIYIGNNSANSAGWIGKIGYVKYAKGSVNFVYSGFKSQPPITDISNLGTRGLQLQRIGLNSASANTTDFPQFVVIEGTGSTAVVDSFDLLVKHHYSFSVSGDALWTKITLARGSDRNQSSVQALAYLGLK